MSLSEEFSKELNSFVEASTNTEKPKEEVKNVPENKEVVKDLVVENESQVVADTENRGAVVEDTAGDGKSESSKNNSEAKVSEEAKGISEFALEKAVQVGFTIGEAKEFPNERALLRAVERVIKADEEAELKYRPKKESDTEDDEDLLSKIADLDPEKYEDPDVINTVNSLKNIIKKQQSVIDEIKGYAKQTAESQSQAAKNEALSWFDNQVESLGTDFIETLGKGRYNSLDKGSLQFQKRNELADKVAILMAGYQQSGRQLPEKEAVFQEAVSIVLKDEIVKNMEKVLQDDFTNRKQQQINRANGKKVGSASDKNSVDDVVAMLNNRFFKT